jgi:hypothetical protein
MSLDKGCEGSLIPTSLVSVHKLAVRQIARGFDCVQPLDDAKDFVKR